MRFGVNVRRLEGQRLGIGRYLEYMLKAWANLLLPSESMELYLRAPLVEGDEWISEAFDASLLSPRLTGITWENISMGPRIKNVDVFFGPSYTIPMTYHGRCVVATHSLNEMQPGAHPWHHKLTFSQLYRKSAERAQAVIVPSNSVKNQVHRHYNIPLEKIEVVREGAPDSFEPLEDEETLRLTRIDYTGREEPYILFVGKFSARRNIPLLIRAFADLKKKKSIPHSLLLVGPNHLNLPLDDLVNQLGVADSVTITNRVFADHQDIVPLYSAADLYAFPSFSEGASNTVVEAMSCGVPVVAGRCDAIADIVEGSGVLVDELSVQSLSNSMEAVLTDSSHWAEMRQRGLDKSLSLRWSRTALETLDILRRVGQA